MVIDLMEEQIIQNLSWFVLPEKISSAGGRAIRVSSSQITLGSRSSLTIGQSYSGGYYFYQNVRDYPRTEWAWLLLFGFVLVVVLIIVAIVGVQNCCVYENEEEESVMSSEENEEDEFEMEECGPPKPRIIETPNITTYSTADTVELFI